MADVNKITPVQTEECFCFISCGERQVRGMEKGSRKNGWLCSEGWLLFVLTVNPNATAKIYRFVLLYGRRTYCTCSKVGWVV